MNVNAIAEQFLLNPAYLSNMFKRNTGIKLLEYINKVRVDESKKMMIQNPELGIEEVAEKAGVIGLRPGDGAVQIILGLCQNSRLCRGLGSVDCRNSSVNLLLRGVGIVLHGLGRVDSL